MNPIFSIPGLVHSAKHNLHQGKTIVGHVIGRQDGHQDVLRLENISNRSQDTEKSFQGSSIGLLQNGLAPFLAPNKR